MDSTPVIPTLPGEITDMIIDFLHNDKQALMACSLASRGFLSACRFHLLARIHLNCRDGPRLHQFLSFLALSPVVAPFIRCLDMIEVERSSKDSTEGYDVQILNCLPKLTSLSIKGSVRDTTLSPSLAERWCTQITTLSMSDLNSRGFRYIDDLVAVLALFTSLEHLTLNDMLWFRQRAHPPHCRLSSALHTLILQDSFNFQFLEWLLLHDPIPQLHTIILTTTYPEESFVISKVLCSLGPSLKHLEFIIPFGHHDPIPGRALLKSLSVSF